MVRRRIWIGLDVGADQTSVCGTDDEGTVLFEQCVPTQISVLHRLLKPDKRRINLIALESGSFGVPLARALVRLGYATAMFEAGQASKYLAIRKNKTDKNDARGLADIARLGRASVSQVRVRSLECQRLRSTLVTRERLVRTRVALEARMRSLLRLNGGRLKRSDSAAALRKNVNDEVARLRKTEKVDLKPELDPLLNLCVAIRDYLHALDEALDKVAAENETCRRFLHIPGVGPLTALTFYCAIEEPARFRRNSDVGAYLGLVPIIKQSGMSVVRLRISKRGDRLARARLTTAAQLHVKYANSAVATWAQGLSRRLGKGAVYTAVARKLAVTMLAMWKTGDAYDPMRSCCRSTPAGAAGWETGTTTEDVRDPASG